MLKALVFDVDGTLAETEEWHRATFNEAFGRLGLPWRWDRGLYGELLAVTGGKERIAHFVSRHRSGGPELSPGDVAALHRLKTEIYGRSVDAGAPLATGRPPPLAEAARAGSGSPSRPRRAGATLSPSSERPSRAKRRSPPSPRATRFRGRSRRPTSTSALALLDLEPAECVTFEDSANGVAAARAAGLPVVATPSA